jgi:RNA polymerase sigma-70 factor (ECF subfamily)
MDALEHSERPLLLLGLARGGDRDALGELLELYRNYLQILAAAQVGTSLRGHVEPSDIVQETFLEAATGFASFRGTSEAELCTWLRRILVHNIADQAKHHRRQERDVDRQVSLDQALDRSSLCLHEALAANLSSPSARAMRRERAVIVADVLAQLSEDHRTVIVLRNLLQLRFEEVAERMHRSPVAVRLLWLRAIERLRGLFQEEP